MKDWLHDMQEIVNSAINEAVAEQLEELQTQRAAQDVKELQALRARNAELEEKVKRLPSRKALPPSANAIAAELADVRSKLEYYKDLNIEEMDKELKNYDDLKFRYEGAVEARKIGLARLEAMEADRDYWKAKYHELLKGNENDK